MFNLRSIHFRMGFILGTRKTDFRVSDPSLIRTTEIFIATYLGFHSWIFLSCKNLGFGNIQNKHKPQKFFREVHFWSLSTNDYTYLGRLQFSTKYKIMKTHKTMKFFEFSQFYRVKNSIRFVAIWQKKWGENHSILFL